MSSTDSHPDQGSRPEFLTGDNVFLAIGPCGCGYGIDTCDDRDAQANVAGWRSEGATVVQVPIVEAKERLILDCPHEPRYGLLPLREARAEVVRLRAECERLRETLKAIDTFPSHVIDGDKGGRWVDYGDGDGYWDDGDVHTDDCPACALSRRIDEALGNSPASDETEATDATH